MILRSIYLVSFMFIVSCSGNGNSNDKKAEEAFAKIDKKTEALFTKEDRKKKLSKLNCNSCRKK